MHRKCHPACLILGLCLVLGLVLVGAVLIVNHRVKASTRDRILTPEAAAELEDIDAIVVLGAGLRPDGSPSDMLRDRLLRACSLFESGVSQTIMMTGDGVREDYNEPASMQAFAIRRGIDAEKILTDPTGLCTYDSIRNVRDAGMKRVVIVTQEYHLYRALYIAKALGLEAWGVSADLQSYRGQSYRELREIAARLKDYLVTSREP